MNSIDDLIAILRDELGLPVTGDDAGRPLDDVPGWDSVHLVWLLTVLEQRTGRSISLPDVLEAPSIDGIYNVVAVAA